MDYASLTRNTAYSKCRFKSLMSILHCDHRTTFGQSIRGLAILPFWRNVLAGHGDSAFQDHETNGRTSLEFFSETSVKDKACAERIKTVIWNSDVGAAS